MRKQGYLLTIFTFAVIISGCSKESGQMTKVVIQEAQPDGSYGSKATISGQTALHDLESKFNDIKWSKDAIPSMARKEDILAKVTYKNRKQEVVYNIWFNQKSETATLLSSDKDESYGMLPKDIAKSLKKQLLHK
ncbi:hypothetical protein [Bacillus sp. 165]|uniref:hypothetical protein n=1 Tax=Bacillus sp. 165 TaxID=1529117 RepID=UPI001ADA3AEC|nr:hypothetical protein [Bacillus sp. 165]MBO9129034.1 hypothetical protein [Bacillus sp. 165]